MDFALRWINCRCRAEFGQMIELQAEYSFATMPERGAFDPMLPMIMAPVAQCCFPHGPVVDHAAPYLAICQFAALSCHLTE